MRHYIGIDLHKQFSSVAVLNGTGQLMDQQKIYHNNQQDVIDYFARGSRDRFFSTHCNYYVSDRSVPTCNSQTQNFIICSFIVPPTQR